MSIATQIARISGNVSDALTAVANKGVTVPAWSNSDDLAGLIVQIEGGGSTIIIEDGAEITDMDTYLLIDDSGSGGGNAVLVAKSITANGTYDPADDNADGYSEVTVNVPSSVINLQAKSGITPTTASQTITPDSGYDGLSSVQIAGDANLVSSNILSGKTIFGVQGGVSFQTYYTGSSAPSSSLGSDGDIYLQT